MLLLTLFLNYRHEYNFSSGKKCLFSERFFLFLKRHAHSKNKHLLLPDFFLNKFFDSDKYF